jgi:LPXTG-motif cell wall-anchored protein
MDTRPFLIIGITLVALGLALLVRRRRGAHSLRRFRHQARSTF